MYLKDLSLWGALLVLSLLGLAMALLWLIDRKMFLRLFAIRIRPVRLPVGLWLTVVVAVLIGGSAMAGCLVLCMPCQLFWPVLSAMIVLLLLTVPKALGVYLQSLRKTMDHRRYLMANGATHLETVVPSVRRALRAALLPVLWHRSQAMPVAMMMLFLGLKMGGTTTAAALVIVLMMWAAAVACSVLSSVLAIWLADRKLPSDKL